MGNLDSQLHNLLLSLFRAEELRRWIRYHHRYAVIADSLPGQLSAPTRLVDVVVDALKRRGFLDAAFFRGLVEVRPGREGEIRPVAAAWAKQVTSDNSPNSPDHLIGRVSMPDKNHALRTFLIKHFDCSRLRSLVEDLPDGNQLLGEIPEPAQQSVASLARGIVSELSKQHRFREPLFALLKTRRSGASEAVEALAALWRPVAVDTGPEDVSTSSNSEGSPQTDALLDQLRHQIVDLLEGQTLEVRRALAKQLGSPDGSSPTQLLEQMVACDSCQKVVDALGAVDHSHRCMYPLMCVVFPYLFETDRAEPLEGEELRGVFRLRVSTRGLAEVCQARAEGRGAAFKLVGAGRMPKLSGASQGHAPVPGGPMYQGTGFRYQFLAALYKELIDDDVSALSEEEMVDDLVPRLRRMADPAQTQYQGVYYVFEDKQTGESWFAALPTLFRELDQSVDFYVLANDRSQKRREGDLIMVLLDAHKREAGLL